MFDRTKRHIIFLFVILIPSVFYGQRFAIISDIHGATTATAEVAALVKSWNPDFIVCSGDNNYACAANIDGQVGQYYHEFIYPYTGAYGTGDTANRYFPAIGNHDEECAGIGAFQSYFTLPGNERYYDFVKGNVHFFCLNSNPDEPDGVTDTSVQALWLKNKLENSNSRYKIVYFHHPAFSSATTHGSTIYMRWPFKQWGATAVFSGHDHVYERFLINDMLYYTCGTGGGGLYSIVSPIAGSQFHDVADHGAMLVVADTDSISFKFINTNDSVIENYTLPYVLTGIADEDSGMDLSTITIYPNPASDQIFVEMNNMDHPEKISIYDAYGRIILIENPESSDKKNIKKIDVSSFPKGMYFLRLSSEKGPGFCKFIIN